MVEHNPPVPADSAHPSVIPLPVALYVSGELIFELYDGGQPCRRFSICWDRFVPGKQSEPEATQQSSPTGLRTRQD
ncbi:MAG TPA: hypothetical protein VH350_06360 [Candidatus Sulfotelmatobacter sp.]|jgi:hypothetical protein|nr:hypothetical protein [Candidatus Sulfotelmatobacter sp.]